MLSTVMIRVSQLFVGIFDLKFARISCETLVLMMIADGMICVRALRSLPLLSTGSVFLFEILSTFGFLQSP